MTSGIFVQIRADSYRFGSVLCVFVQFWGVQKGKILRIRIGLSGLLAGGHSGDFFWFQGIRLLVGLTMSAAD